MKLYYKTKMKVLMRRLTNKKGLTLIELLIVIGVLAILALLAVPAGTDYFKNAQMETMKADGKVLLQSAVAYKSESGKLPVLDTPITEVDWKTEAVVKKALGNAGVAEPDIVYPLLKEKAFRKINESSIKGYMRKTVDISDYFIINEVGHNEIPGYNNELKGEILSIHGLDNRKHQIVSGTLWFTDTSEKSKTPPDEDKEPLTAPVLTVDTNISLTNSMVMAISGTVTLPKNAVVKAQLDNNPPINLSVVNGYFSGVFFLDGYTFNNGLGNLLSPKGVIKVWAERSSGEKSAESIIHVENKSPMMIVLGNKDIVLREGQKIDVPFRAFVSGSTKLLITAKVNNTSPISMYYTPSNSTNGTLHLEVKSGILYTTIDNTTVPLAMLNSGRNTLELNTRGSNVESITIQYE